MRGGPRGRSPGGVPGGLLPLPWLENLAWGAATACQWGDYPIALPRNTPHAPHCGASLRIIMLRRAKLDNGRFVDAEGGRVPGPGPSSASLLAPFDDLAGSEESSSDSEPEEQHTPMVDGGLLVRAEWRGTHTRTHTYVNMQAFRLLPNLERVTSHTHKHTHTNTIYFDTYI